MENEIKNLSKELSSVDDGGKMKSYLRKIKRKIKKKTVKIDRVMKDFDNLIKIYNKKAKWLDKADSKLRNQVQSLFGLQEGLKTQVHNPKLCPTI